MNTSDFLAELTRRYPALDDGTLGDIRSLVERLSNQQRKDLFDSFTDSYDYASPPKRATFRKLMGKLNFYDSKTLEVYGYCKECRTHFRNDIRTCPLCNSVLVLTTDEPKRYVDVQKHCNTCAKFQEGVQGAVCQYYGRGSHTFANRVEQIKLCKACPCKNCCYEEFVVNERPYLYNELLARNEFDGGYVKK